MRPSYTHLLPLCLLITTCRSADPKPCTVISSDGKYYDLNPLKSNKDYVVTLPPGSEPNEMWINVCQAVNKELFGLKDVSPESVAGTLRRKSDFSIGTVSTNLTMYDTDRPRIAIKDGSKCTGSLQDKKASSTIDFICDRSVFSAGTPKLANYFPDDLDDACNFVIEWRTHFACPTAPPSGPWGFFAFLAVTCVVLAAIYLVLGTIYNRYVLHLTGFDQIPSFSWEGFRYHCSEMFELAKDWFHSFSSSGGYHPPGGWDVRTPRSASARANPFSHQAQQGPPPQPQGNGFVRPGPRGSVPPSRTATNPVSHFSATQQQDAPQPPPKDLSPSPVPRKNQYDKNATRDEREFLVGDDDEEDEGEEMKTPPGPQTIALPPTGESAPSQSQSQPPPPQQPQPQVAVPTPLGPTNAPATLVPQQDTDSRPGSTGPAIPDDNDKTSGGAIRL